MVFNRSEGMFTHLTVASFWDMKCQLEAKQSLILPAGYGPGTLLSIHTHLILFDTFNTFDTCIQSHTHLVIFSFSLMKKPKLGNIISLAHRHTV